jgi:hypothetical protein
MVTSLTSELVEVVRTAARAMAGFARRNFQATMATKFCDSNPRLTESVFGRNRKAVRRGLEEQKLGKPLRLSDDPRGRPTVETQDPTILRIIDAPKCASTFTRWENSQGGHRDA